MYIYNSKIYYNKNTGEVIHITPEQCGSIEIKTTMEEDLINYKYNPNDIDYITLEYNTLEATFLNCKSYYVDTNAKQLVIIRYTNEELKDMEQEEPKSQLELLQEENEKLIEQIIDLKAENLLLKKKG